MGEEHNVLLSLFINDLFAGRSKAAVAAEMQNVLGGSFEETILPFNDSDENIPRIILKSREEPRTSIEIFLNRVNVRTIYRAFQPNLTGLLYQHMMTALNLSPFRVGLVRGDILSISNPPEEILNHYIREGVLTGVRQSKLHFLLTQEVQARPINLWVKLEAIQQGYLVEFDANSSIENTSIFTPEQAQSFIVGLDSLITQSYGQYGPSHE